MKRGGERSVEETGVGGGAGETGEQPHAMADGGDDEDLLHPSFPICHRTSSCSTLPEHHSALYLLHQLDHSWFRENVLSAPSSRSCVTFHPPSPPPQRSSSSLRRLPYRSIELVEFLNGSLEPRKPNTLELPCAHFEKLQRRRTLETAPESCTAPRSANRRSRKLLDEIQISVPRQRPSEALYQKGTTAVIPIKAPVSDPARVLGIGIDRRSGNCESSSNKGKHIVEVARSPKLQTITSGKHLWPSLTDSQQQEISVKRWLRRERRRSSKSMTDLEIDELQGCMDLGFHFTKDDLTPRVVNMFPALQRQQTGQVEGGRSPELTSWETKPFWSEAWWIQRPVSPILKWRIPAQAEGSVNMKEHLKFWARAVASTVRQEC